MEKDGNGQDPALGHATGPVPTHFPIRKEFFLESGVKDPAELIYGIENFGNSIF